MLLLLSVFMVQFTTNQVTHDKLLFAQKDISTSMQEVKQQGCLTPEIKTALTESLKQDLHLTDATGIEISSSHENIAARAERGDLISYTVIVPVKDLIGASNFLGVADDDTTKTYSGYVASEWVGM